MKPNGSRVWRGGRALRLLGLILGMLGLTGNSHAENIRVFPEPWQVLEPGKPQVRFPARRVISEGIGPIIGPGDLVQIRIYDQSTDKNIWNDRGEWWIWVGFRTQKETTFFSYEPLISSALVGLNPGTVFEFIEAKEGIGSGPQYAGKLYPNIFGDFKYYGWRKNLFGFAYLYVSDTSGLSKFEIKRVCKGKAQYRTVRLFDDSPVQRCTWAPIQCSMIDTPREGWIDEARIEAVCQDGRTATFQYGPVASRNGKEWTGPINPHNYFEPWEAAAWKKLPVGVQLK